MPARIPNCLAGGEEAVHVDVHYDAAVAGRRRMLRILLPAMVGDVLLIAASRGADVVQPRPLEVLPDKVGVRPGAVGTRMRVAIGALLPRH